MSRLPPLETCLMLPDSRLHRDFTPERGPDARFQCIKLMINYMKIMENYPFWKPDIIKKAWLVTRSQDGNYYDFLRNILIICTAILSSITAIESLLNSEKKINLEESPTETVTRAIYQAAAQQSNQAGVKLGTGSVFTIALSRGNLSDLVNMEKILLENPSFIQQVELIGKHQVKETVFAVNAEREYRLGVGDIVLAPLFMCQNTSFCAVYLSDANQLKVYRQTGKSNMQLVAIRDKTSKIPPWVCVKRVDYELNHGALHSCHHRKRYTFWNQKRLIPVFQECTAKEQALYQSLAKDALIPFDEGENRNWGNIIHGRPVSHRQGFCLLSLHSILAGISIWFSDLIEFNWIQFPGVIRKNGCHLSLGSCSVKSPKMPDKRVTVIANCDCIVWSTDIMMN